MRSSRWSKLLRAFFYGNYFYGICAIALSIEAGLQQHIPLAPAAYYLAVFAITVVYYSRAYIAEIKTRSANERLFWYEKNKRFVYISQNTLAFLTAIILLYFVIAKWHNISFITPLLIFLILLFPLVGIFYYGVSDTRYSLRRIGWLKPFVIGFAWAGLVNIYPLVFHSFYYGEELHPGLINILLFQKNFMFVSILCIMFDIKDYASDSGFRLNTFVVKFGLRKTIFFIILPLCIVGLGTFVIYGISKDFHPFKIVLNVLPFIFLIITAYTLSTRRSLLYYLVVVDGLMLLKGICGSIAMIYF